MVKLILLDTCLYMSSTVFFMFKLEYCVENVYSVPVSLMKKTHIVNEKFKYFVILFLDENYIIDKCDAVDFLRKIYN